MAKVVWTAEAERWLLKIHDYIAVDSPFNAFNVVKSIYQRAQILERPPLAGHAYRSPSSRDLRIFLWGHYRIVYLVRPGRQEPAELDGLASGRGQTPQSAPTGSSSVSADQRDQER